ncbi:MAG: universal stress protein [Actinobacteria bacterium]|nr:universal stress protein [Actinomycetota bacterium]
MTIIAGFSWGGQSAAPLNLAARIARCTGEKIVATAIVERHWPPKADPLEDEYLGHISSAAKRALEEAVAKLPSDLDTWAVVHQSNSVPTGLTELATEIDAGLVVVGSSSSGLLGRVALGSVTDRLVHTASVPVAIAPRAYPTNPAPIDRLTVSYGGQADAVGLIAASADLAKRWSVRLRIVSFAVRPVKLFAGSVESSAENLVIEQWTRRTVEEISGQLSDVRAAIALPDVEVVIGAGHDWREAVDDVSWETGDLLVLGSGAAGQSAQVFLGSAASKILRNTPVPVMILPRRQAA